jgi:glycosyltransferase involved in cell wall biosynthesis
MSAIRVVEVVGNATGGGTQFAAALMRHLTAADFDLTLVAPEAPALARLCQEVGAHFHPLPLMSGRMRRDVRQRLGNLLREASPAIVHAHGTRAAWYVSRCLPMARRPPLFMYSEHLFSHDARRGLAKLPWYLIEWMLCHRADLLTTGCASNARRMVRTFRIPPKRIVIEHYGVDLAAVQAQVHRPVSRAAIGLPEHVPVIGTVGRLIPQKGIRYLIDAMARIVAHYPDAICLVVGDGELRGALEEHCRHLELQGHVRFLGAHDAPWSILAACDVIALSSLHEGLWLTLVEALAAGMPVVATRTGGAMDIITSGQNGQLVARGNAVALAEAIERLLADQSLQARFRGAGPDSVAGYDLVPVLDALRGVYLSRAEHASQIE